MPNIYPIFYANRCLGMNHTLSRSVYLSTPHPPSPKEAQYARYCRVHTKQDVLRTRLPFVTATALLDGSFTLNSCLAVRRTSCGGRNTAAVRCSSPHMPFEPTAVPCPWTASCCPGRCFSPPPLRKTLMAWFQATIAVLYGTPLSIPSQANE